MRGYGTIKPAFWTGETGYALRAEGLDAQTLALYLLTSPMANLLGLYYLPLPTVRKHLAMPMPDILEAFAALKRAEFAAYDEDAEVVWVYNMVIHQTSASAKDKRNRAVDREYQNAPSCRFLEAFFERYAEVYGIRLQRKCPLFIKPLFESEKPPVLVLVPDPVLGEKEPTDRDVAFAAFAAEYPAAQRDTGPLAQQWFIKVTTGMAGHSEIEARKVLVDRLVLHKRSKSWASGYIPDLVNWLKGKWTKELEPMASAPAGDEDPEIARTDAKIAEMRRMQAEARKTA